MPQNVNMRSFTKAFQIVFCYWGFIFLCETASDFQRYLKNETTFFQ